MRAPSTRRMPYPAAIAIFLALSTAPLKAATPNDLGPSIVTTSGRQLLVRQRNPDGSLGSPAPYAIRGLNWSPASRDTNTSTSDPNAAAILRAEFGKWYATDAPLFRAMKVNTVRVYVDPGTDATGLAVLDELYRNNVMVIMTVDNGVNDTNRLQQVVAFYKNHPAVLMWLLGNEWNINRYYGAAASVADAAARTQTAAALLKSLDANHPVAASYGEINIGNVDQDLPATANYVNTTCPAVDVWGLNIYRGSSFGALFDEWKAISAKPMFIGEFGADALYNLSGLVDDTAQAHWNLCLWNEIQGNLSAQDSSKSALGGVLFEWNDEWWKVQPAGSQQTGGFAGAQPDGFANEEYFGVVDIDRVPRLAYTALTAAFDPAYAAPPRSIVYGALSRGSAAAEYNGQVGTARLYSCGQPFYFKNGGAGGGRGFNASAIDPATGIQIQPAQNFDTYATSNTGSAMNALIAYLNSLPTGTVVSLAVADEAGLTSSGANRCVKLPGSWTEAGLQALEALGSRQIRNYCFQDSWAMVAVKGEGVAREESLRTGAAASVKLTAAGPALAIAVTHSGNFTRGQPAVYSLAVSNQAVSSSMSGTITVTEIVPRGLAVVSMTGQGWTCPAGGVTCTRSDPLAAGLSYAPIAVTVNVAADAPSLVIEEASVTGGLTASSRAIDSTAIVAAPQWSISKTHTGNFTQGQTGAVYTLTVSNAAGVGPSSGTVTVTETVPTGITLVSMTGTGWSCAATACTRSDALNGGSSYPPITVTVNVAVDALSQVINQVSASGGGSAAASAADPTIILARPAFSIAKTHTGNFTQGQTGAVYTLTVSNAAGVGPSSGTVTVTETVPTGITLVSMTGAGWSCAAATCTRNDPLNGGSSYPPITVTVNVAANAPALATNQVTVSGGGSPNAGASDPAAVNCAVSVYPTVLGASATAGKVTLTLTSGSCGWTAASGIAWLTPLATSGSSSTLDVNVGANLQGGTRIGTITVAGQPVTIAQSGNNPFVIPALVSLNPFQGIGPTSKLTFVYSHPDGWNSIKSAEFIVNPRWEATSRSGGCYIKYSPGTGLFTLIADDGISTAGAAAPGSAAIISNSQCALNAASSSVTISAPINFPSPTLTVVASLTFQASFSGQKHIWMQAVDYNNVSTNWLVYGVWFPTATTVSAGPWYRIYDPFSNSYLYTFDKNEYDTLGARGFALQGVSGLVMDSPTTVGGISNIAWYRVFVNATSSHLWTSDRNEFLTLVNAQQAYVGEGVAAFVMPYINAQGQVSPPVTNTIPFYRAAFQGANLHFWTQDADEFFNRNGKHLPAGYLGEGIACYIFPSTGAQFTSALAADDDAPAVISAANGAIAPGQALSIYGRHLGGRVLLNGAPAKVISARDNEIQILAPDDLAIAAEVTLEVEHRGHRSKATTLEVVAANPAIFGTNQYGRGNAQARNEDGETNDPRHPAKRGSIVTLYTTGVGVLDLPLEVHIGGHPAEVLSTHVSGTRAGVVEVQIRVPFGIDPADFQPVVLHVGHMFSQPGIGLAIQ